MRLRRPGSVAVQSSKLERRIEAVRDPALLRDYAETAIHSVGRSLSEYDRSRSLDALETAVHDAEALSLLLSTLYSRLGGE